MSERIRDMVSWLLVMTAALTAADLVTAWAERALWTPPRPLPSLASPASAHDPMPEQFQSLLGTSTPVTSEPDSTTTRTSGTMLNRLPVPSLQLNAVLLGEGRSGIAVVSADGKTLVLEPGAVIGGLSLSKLRERSVTFDGPAGPLTLELGASPTQAQTAAVTKQASLRDLGIFRRGIRVTPVVVDGEMQGAKLLFSDPNHPLVQAGMRSGDTVLSVNSTVLDSPESIVRVRQEFSESSSLRLELLRNGQRQTLRLELD